MFTTLSKHIKRCVLMLALTLTLTGPLDLLPRTVAKPATQAILPGDYEPEVNWNS